MDLVSERLHLDLFDPARGREVPVSLHLPGSGVPSPWPLVVFSTGFGGGRDGYGGLARAWSDAGLAVAVLEHPGSGPEALARLNRLPRQQRNAALQWMVRDPAELQARPLDVSFVLDRLALDSRLDSGRIGLGGHSLGAVTTLAVGGIPLSVSAGSRRLLHDLRPRALLAMSPPTPGQFFAPADHARLERPILLVTGTRDHGPFLEGPREDRTRVFPLLTSARAWQAVFEGADHMTFAEMGLNHRPFMAPLRLLSVAFWQWALAEGPALDAGLVAREVAGPERLRWESSGPAQPPPGQLNSRAF